MGVIYNYDFSCRLGNLNAGLPRGQLLTFSPVLARQTTLRSMSRASPFWECLIFGTHAPSKVYRVRGNTNVSCSSTHESYKSFHYHLLSFNPELFHVYRCPSLSSCSQKPFERIREWRVWSIHPWKHVFIFFLQMWFVGQGENCTVFRVPLHLFIHIPLLS